MINHISDEQLSNMSVGQIAEMFDMAKRLGGLDTFCVEFWARMSKLNESKTTICKQTIRSSEANEIMRLIVMRHNDLRNLILNESKEIKQLVTNIKK